MDVSRADYQSTTHTSPRKNVLLLSCMDLRLLDNLVKFMNFENLENRYDQFILAGAAAGAMQMPSWHKAFFDHLVLAVGLHEIKYVYIVEHRDCGAYTEFFETPYVKYDADAGHNIYDLETEHKDHSRQAFLLKADIDNYCRERRVDPYPSDETDPVTRRFREIVKRSYGKKPDLESLKHLWDIEVRCFMMNLRGGVDWLNEYDDTIEDEERLNTPKKPGRKSRTPREG
jgi:hypothetical protein